MLKKCIWAVALTTSVWGCGSEDVSVPFAESASGGETAALIPVESLALEDPGLPGYEVEGLAILPSAPWSTDLVAASALPSDVAAVLASADNREWCSAMIPAGATQRPARATNLDGGWAIEFDSRGAPGLRANGSTCARCGRGAFGIAGTAMTTDEIVDIDTGIVPSPVFSDGSTQQLEAEEGVASATITVGGQGCVYQVWSFMGEEHLNSLLEDLRFVERESVGNEAVAAH